MPTLEKRFGKTGGALAFVPLWAFWHTPLFWITPGYRSMELAGVLGWLASLVAGSIVLQRVRHSSNSVLAVILFHAGMDIFFNSRSPQGVMNMMGALITILGVLVFFKNLQEQRGRQT